MGTGRGRPHTAGTPGTTIVTSLAELDATAGVKTVHTPNEASARDGVVFAREFLNAPGAERKAAA
jgi:hypothetical protein